MAPRKNTGKRAQRRPKRKTAKRKSGKVIRKTSRKQSKRSKKSQKTRKNTPKRREERFTKQEIQDLKLVANEIKEKSEEADQIQLAEIENEIGRPFTKQEEKLIQDAQKAEESYAKLKKALKYGAGAAAIAGIAGLGSRYLKRGDQVMTRNL